MITHYFTQADNKSEKRVKEQQSRNQEIKFNKGKVKDKLYKELTNRG